MSLGASSASEKRCHMDFKGYRQALEQIDEECSKEDLDAWAQSQFQRDENAIKALTPDPFTGSSRDAARLADVYTGTILEMRRASTSGPHDPPFFLKKQIHEGYARNI